MNATDSDSIISMISAQESGPRKVSLKDLIPKLDLKQIDILLFMMIFEGQAKGKS